MRELAPDQSATYQTLADVALDAGEWAEAEENARQAIALEPEDFRAFRLLGQSLWPQNRQRESVDAYYEASRLAPTNERMRDVFVHCVNDFCAGEDLTPEPSALASKFRHLLWKLRHETIAIFIVVVTAVLFDLFGRIAVFLWFFACLLVAVFADRNPAFWQGRRWRELPPAMRRLYLLQRRRRW